MSLVWKRFSFNSLITNVIGFYFPVPMFKYTYNMVTLLNAETYLKFKLFYWRKGKVNININWGWAGRENHPFKEESKIEAAVRVGVGRQRVQGCSLDY